MKTIGIIGSRRRDEEDDKTQLIEALKKVYRDGDRFVSGGCPSGGDYFAERIAKSWQVSITIHYAKWGYFGRGAGFVRNTDIANDADILIALVAPDRTGGTEDTIKKVRKLGKDVLVLEKSP